MVVSVSVASMGTRTSYSPGTFCWADLATSDPAAAKDFYTGLFGWDVEDMPAGEGAVYSICRVGGAPVAALYGQSPEQREQGWPPVWLNYVTVVDADATATRVAELGGTVVEAPFEVMEAGRMCILADPQGATLLAWQPRRHPGAGLVNEPGAMTWNDLQTSDVAAAARFYSELFGWTVAEVPESGGRYWTIQGAEGANGGMMPLPAPDVPPHWQPYFAVESLDAARTQVEELGGTVLMGPMPVPGGAFLAIRDPQGAAFSLFAGELDP